MLQAPRLYLSEGGRVAGTGTIHRTSKGNTGGLGKGQDSRGRVVVVSQAKWVQKPLDRQLLAWELQESGEEAEKGGVRGAGGWLMEQRLMHAFPTGYQPTGLDATKQ